LRVLYRLAPRVSTPDRDRAFLILYYIEAIEES